MKSWKLLCCLVSLGALLAVAEDAAARPVKQALHPTVADKNARGRVVVSIHRAGKKMQGKMLVVGHNLSPYTRFGVSVAGVHIGTFTTNRAGSGAARFSSRPSGHAQFLGVDPRGKLLEVSDGRGEDVMEAEMPDSDDTGEAGDIQCCLTGDDGTECEETEPDECAAENGTNMGAGSCFPDPCPTSQPMPDMRCCLPDEDGPECEEEDAAECSAAGGVNLGAGTCEPDPCAPTGPAVVRCCISEDDEDDQEGELQSESPECEQLTPGDCTAEGGTSLGAGSCEPNPCVSSVSGAFLGSHPRSESPARTR